MRNRRIAKGAAESASESSLAGRLFCGGWPARPRWCLRVLVGVVAILSFTSSCALAMQEGGRTPAGREHAPAGPGSVGLGLRSPGTPGAGDESVWVEYDGKRSALAEEITLEAERLREKVAADLGLVAGEKIKIRLYSSSSGFRRAVGAKEGQIIVGIAHSDGNLIEMDGSGLLESPQDILAHEMTHVLLRQHLGECLSSLPLWLNEGLAQMESAPLPIAGRDYLGEVASQGLLLSLDSLGEAFPEEPEGMSLAYLESQSATEFLRQKHGMEAIRQVLGLLREGEGFDEAFAEATGVSFEEFQGQWDDAQRERPIWEILFRGGAPMGVWAAAALLVLYGFLRLQRRWRRKMKEWEEEERWERFDRP